MARHCKAPGCSSFRWSHGYCQHHQHLRSDPDWVKKQAAKAEKKQAKIEKAIEAQKEARRKRPRLVRISKPANAEIVCSTKDGRLSELFRGEYEMFKYIWETREHVSFLSGLPIIIAEGTDLWFSCFAHVLSKAKNRYPAYKLYEKNVVLMLPNEHMLYDQGTIKQRADYAEKTGCSWNKITMLADELKQQYPNIP